MHRQRASHGQEAHLGGSAEPKVGSTRKAACICHQRHSMRPQRRPAPVITARLPPHCAQRNLPHCAQRRVGCHLRPAGFWGQPCAGGGVSEAALCQPRPVRRHSRGPAPRRLAGHGCACISPQRQPRRSGSNGWHGSGSQPGACPAAGHAPAGLLQVAALLGTCLEPVSHGECCRLLHAVSSDHYR